jgi:cyclin H
MLAAVPPDSQPGEAEMRELKGLAKKLNRCRDPEKADLVGLRRAKRDGDGEEELRKAKKRKLEREKVQKEGDDLFGPALVKRDA